MASELHVLPADPLSAALRRALQGALSPRTSAEEGAWIARIEALRAELESCDRRVEIRDFGAGEPGAGLAAEEMRRGRLVVRSVGEMCALSSKRQRWCRLLFRMVRELRPARSVELGTCLGISAAYQAAALELNGAGALVTLEGAPALAAEAGAALDRLRLGHRVRVEVGRFSDTLGPVLAERGPFDLVFVDGHHDHDATLDYFGLLMERGERRPSVIVLDDIDWPGMDAAWATIAADERVRIALDLGPVGVCVCDRPGRERLRLELAYEAAMRD